MLRHPAASQFGAHSKSGFTCQVDQKVAKKNTPKALTGEVLQELADLAGVPAARREAYFDSVRKAVQTACELHGLVKGGLANTSLHSAALTLYDALGKLNKRQRALLEAILGKREFAFDRISNEGVGELRQTAYEIARLFSLVTGKASPRDPHQPSQSRQGGRGTVKHPVFTTAAGGNLTNMRTLKMAPSATPSRC